MTGRRSGTGRGRGDSGLGGSRMMTTRVRTAGKRSAASTRWLERQLNDPYVAEAKRRGYRSRAAFKLIQLDEKYHLLKPGMRVVDLGAAPGGWTQIAVARTGADRGAGAVVGIDLLAVDPLPGASLIQADFLDSDAPARLKTLLGGPADIVLSDMAAVTTGHAKTDHLRIAALADAAYDFAAEILAQDGAFVAKLFQGGAERELLDRLRRDFRTVRHAKPPASRSDSSELYIVATGFRGS